MYGLFLEKPIYRFERFDFAGAVVQLYSQRTTVLTVPAPVIVELL